jgi:hypothetical protein
MQMGPQAAKVADGPPGSAERPYSRTPYSFAVEAHP